MVNMCVRYRERQTLRTADLNDEQACRLAGRRRHNIASHEWGIVEGLALAAAMAGFWVQPGMAVDGYGRELVVAEAVFCPGDLFDKVLGLPDNKSPRIIGVWLLYQRVEGGAVPQAGGGQFSRWREAPVLQLLPGRADDSRRPPGISDEVLKLGVHQNLPDGSDPAWRVYLGSVHQEASGECTVDLAGRPYAGLIAEAITAPATIASIETVHLSSGLARFAVRLPALAGTDAEERLTIDNGAQPMVRVYRPLRLAGNKAAPEADLTLAPPAAFTPDDIVDPVGLVDKLTRPQDRVWPLLPSYAQDRLKNGPGSFRTVKLAQIYLAAVLNRVARQHDLFDAISGGAPLEALQSFQLSAQSRIAPGAHLSAKRLASLKLATEASSVFDLGQALLREVYHAYLAPALNAAPAYCGIAFQPLAAPPAAAAAWQIYRTVVPPLSQPTTAPENARPAPPTDQLRVEIADPSEKGDRSRRRLSIGYRDRAGAFVACMTVHADGNVTVGRMPEVAGETLEGPIQADPRDPRFAALLLEQAGRGQVVSASGLTVKIGFKGEAVQECSKPGRKFAIKVSNCGKSRISGIQVYENIVVDGTPVRQGPVDHPAFTLEPPVAPQTDSGITICRDLPADLAGKLLVVSVVALGIGPGPLNVQASDSQETMVSELGAVEQAAADQGVRS